MAELEQQLAAATSTAAILQTEKEKLQSEVQESKKEQDDLLMLLADQDQKIHSLKKRLKDLGETVRKPDLRASLSETVLHCLTVRGSNGSLKSCGFSPIHQSRSTVHVSFYWTYKNANKHLITNIYSLM